MARAAKIGLLPLYLKLYDDLMPERRAEFDPFLAEIAAGFRQLGIEVIECRVCRVQSEFEQAVDHLESAAVDLIVTVHLAYSPSLESIEALTGTELPILMLDTTMDRDFGKDVDAARIMYNHGIHGVQDLACMLRRLGKPFQIVAGHLASSEVLARAADIARGAYAAQCLAYSRTLRLGPAFVGMGDFAVDEDVLESELGITVDELSRQDLERAARAISAAAIKTEMADDLRRFAADLTPTVHRRSVRTGLGLRALLESGGYSAFSMNFLAFDSAKGPANVVPFLEASKAMSRGIGYAGEGDVLTASLVGALGSAFGRTTFTEIFCPEWQGNSLFLSHMGEINPEVIAGTPALLEKPYPFSAALNPAMICGAPAAGRGILVNLAPGPDNRFGLIAARVEILGDSDNPSLHGSVRGWIRPDCDLAAFLEKYSRNGGTHHSALVLGDRLEGITAFAEFVGLECVIL
jgi:L-arabinose isomerase